LDANGEATKEFMISHISQAEEAVVTVHESKRHSFQDGDFVKFSEVQGMDELNNGENYKVKNCKPYQFTVEVCTKNMKPYER
jgi:ubiquitin-activating enzyme E1